MDVFGRIIVTILAVILIFLYPLQYLASNQEAVLDNHVHSETTQFTDEIMLQGSLTLDQYTEFINKLDITNQLYKVELIHSKPIEGYDTSNIKISDYKGNQVTNHEHDAEVSCIYPEKRNGTEGFTSLLSLKGNRKALTPIPNSSGIGNAVPLTSIHAHSQDCYAGHRHNTSTCTYSIIPPYVYGYIERPHGGGSYSYYYVTNQLSTVFTGLEYAITFSSSISGTSNGVKYLIPRYPLDNGDDAASLWIWETNPLYGVLIPQIGYNPKLYFYTGINGSNIEGDHIWNCGINQDTTPICNQVVTSIAPTVPTQTILQGESIVTMATATYLDGTTGTVNCTSNYNGSIGTQSITLTYNGLVYNAKTNGSIACSTTVTTKSKTVPSSLSVIPSSYTVFYGTEPTYTVIVNYDVNTSKTITAGYTKTGFTDGAGTKTVNFTYTENNKIVSESITIIVKRNTKTCVKGHTYELDDYDTDNGCPTCEQIIESISVSPHSLTVVKGNSLDNITVTATYYDSHTKTISNGWSSNFNQNQLGEQVVTITYEGKSAEVNVTVIEVNLICQICGLEYPPDEDGSDPGCPICGNTTVSITATPSMQSVPLGEYITLEVIATYLDGHSAIVTDWLCDFNAYKVGVQTVTIFYGTAKTTVTVMVNSELQTTCPICGSSYNPIEYPNGCPNCSKIVERIEAKLRNGENQVQLGSELNLAVVLIFQDGHREIASNGWSVEGYESEVLGMQTLTILYDVHQTTLTIEVVNSLSKTVCVNGHEYYLNEDGSDPGCPYCNTEGNPEDSQGYFDCIYTDAILEELYTNGTYYFEQGDYITVTVTPKNFTFLDLLQNLFYSALATEAKYSYGGMIRFGKYI